MKVQVKDSLTAVAVRIYDDAITVLRETFFASDLGRSQKEMSKRFFIRRVSCIKRVDMMARNYENVRRSLRAQIVESDADVILEHTRRANFARGDLTEEAVINLHISDKDKK